MISSPFKINSGKRIRFLVYFPIELSSYRVVKRECLVLVEVSKTYLGTTFENTTLLNSVLSLVIKTSNEPFVGFQMFFKHIFHPTVLENNVTTFTLYGKESCYQNHSFGMKTRFFR